mmetsp:Transcript_60157/g.169701  ORF Transcript_60157/g.169701 Transcript_60157/m.169701 type:complete len:232 (-) Transcript_60157:1182-1877(-)
MAEKPHHARVVPNVHLVVEGCAQEPERDCQEEGLAAMGPLPAEVGASLPPQDVHAGVEVEEEQPEEERCPQGDQVRPRGHPRRVGQEEHVDDEVGVGHDGVQVAGPQDPLGVGGRHLGVQLHAQAADQVGGEVAQERDRDDGHEHACREKNGAQLLLEKVRVGIDAVWRSEPELLQEVHEAPLDRVEPGVAVDLLVHEVDLPGQCGAVEQHVEDLPPHAQVVLVPEPPLVH